MGKYTLEYLQSKTYEEMTTGERVAASKIGLYPPGYRNTLPCTLCNTGTYYKSHSVCRKCYISHRREAYTKDSCPKCGALKSKISPQCRKCRNSFYTGVNASNWKGGYRLDKSGYAYRYVTGHPRCGNRNAVFEHILVMEKHLGRYLFPNEAVHHKNGIRNDNRLENLELWSFSHPSGQRVEDLIAWCKELINDYPDYFRT